ncbi:uncharacterized protein LOC125005407 [Mugil cephalus]|uniref:uncharacterized protein LOC125005407 n=1 Tax=Mugil cephalus TaxID=48193 RepID=UPI001FB6FE91|nr:uncharacterized protein LOC125005407 [Mugil cephalus]
MSGSQYQWAEDDFLPAGAVRMTRQPDNNKTYVMYHGTTKANAQSILASGFQQSADGMLGRGVYLSRDLQKASRYPIGHPVFDRVVIKVVVNVGNVISINRQNHPYQKTWHDHGYDTAWVPPKCGMVKSGLEEDCVWDPKRIQIQQVMKPTQTQPGISIMNLLELLRLEIHRHINMSYGSQYQWDEDDFLAAGEVRMLEEPAEDKTYVMYHGTTRANAQRILAFGFHRSANGMLGPGVYLSRDLQKASRYPIGHPFFDRVVIRVSVNVGKVIAIDHQNHPHQKNWHNHGYDTAWVPPDCGMVKSGLEENCVWDPKRIQIQKVIKPSRTPISLESAIETIPLEWIYRPGQNPYVCPCCGQVFMM